MYVTVVGRSKRKIILILKMIAFISILALILAGIIKVSSIITQHDSEKSQGTAAYLLELIDIDQMGKKTLEQGIPGMLYLSQDNSQNPGDVLVAMSSLININDPRALLESQMSYINSGVSEGQEVTPVLNEDIILYEEDFTEDAVEKNIEEPLEQKPSNQFDAVDGPLVAIYNSHNGETYTPTHGVPRIDGKQGGVVDVARVLAEALENTYGIGTVRSEEMHDYPSYTLSYSNSLKTVEAILREHPSVEIVIDVHRDYQPTRAQSVATINGEKAARILLVVGNDARQIHPRWRQNLAFANRLETKMDEMYPGLSRGIRQLDGRYNQHLHQRALLVEVGSAENTLEEAKRSAELLADVLNEMLKEIQNPEIN